MKVAKEFKKGRYYVYDPSLVKTNPAIEIDLPLQKRAIEAYLMLYGPRPKLIEIIDNVGYCGKIHIIPEFTLEFERYECMSEFLFG